ncbi:McrC family protein [Halomonas sp. HL-93]|uniref:McrC family protein n=1 Tax=Halomonas sp. HL-93 TaxID=1666906 RepID=UPI0006DA7BA5|nr:hypothetical protein [Halomonas sp. HL-93]KPQ19677.1 MAG: 5-methylcytosine-specific restriction enzyme subunit McrC [Halomonas sp. HL-93]SBR52022.1 5-methylcytosine-specific restriction endonuclease McrBC, regulatory subunit McrC [Halomonas sp. HL-93]
MDIVHVCENDKLVLPKRFSTLETKERLMRLSENSPTPIFRKKGGEIYALESVGAVSIGGIRISILPKTQTGNASFYFLEDFLRSVGYLKNTRSRAGYSAISKGDPLELVIDDLVRKIEDGISHNLPRRYVSRNERSSVIKGRINFSEAARSLPTEKLLVPITHTPLTRDNPLTKLVKWTVVKLLALTRSARNRAALLSIADTLDDVNERSLRTSDIKNLVIGRYERDWEEVVIFARLLAENHSLDATQAGLKGGVTITFAMAHLFEKLMRSVLKRVLLDSSVTPTHLTPEKYHLESVDEKALRLRLRPDYVFFRDDEPVFVGDAKWKKLSRYGRNLGLSPSDFYQVNAYLSSYGLSEALLFFPKSDWMESGWRASYNVVGESRSIHIVSVDVESIVSRDKKVRDAAEETLRVALLNIFGF